MLFERAAQFKLLGIGACSFRAAHAALTLVNIFSEQVAEKNIKVFMLSSPKKDQFVVTLTIKDMSDPKTSHEFIYDPLTNPSLIFTRQEYAKVLAKFPDVPRPTNAYKQQITTALVERFTRIYPQLRNTYLGSLNIKLPSNEIFRGDRRYMSFYEGKYPDLSDFDEVHEAARQYIQRMTSNFLAQLAQIEDQTLFDKQLVSFFKGEDPRSKNNPLVQDLMEKIIRNSESLRCI